VRGNVVEKGVSLSSALFAFYTLQSQRSFSRYRDFNYYFLPIARAEGYPPACLRRHRSTLSLGTTSDGLVEKNDDLFFIILFSIVPKSEGSCAKCHCCALPTELRADNDTLVLLSKYPKYARTVM